MTIVASATDDKISVVTAEKGIKGDSGADGTDGVGLNFVRGGRISSPTLSCLKSNAFTDVGVGSLTWSRNSEAYGFNRYNEFATADVDVPRLETQGWLIETESTNLLLNSATLSTQDVIVTAEVHTLSFYGTGSVALSGVEIDTLAGTGAGDRVALTFTPAAGTLTLTVTGSVTMAQLEQNSIASSYIPTTASAVTRLADEVSVTTGGNVPLLSGGYTVAMVINTKEIADSVTILSLPDDFTLSISLADGLTATHGINSVSETISANQSYRVIVTYDGTDLAMYIDSVSAGSVTAASVNGTDPDGQTIIGQNFNGWINELSLYDFAFNSSEVELLGE